MYLKFVKYNDVFYDIKSIVFIENNGKCLGFI